MKKILPYATALIVGTISYIIINSVFEIDKTIEYLGIGATTAVIVIVTEFTVRKIIDKFDAK